MGLFFDVLSSINNPNQQGNVSQLESVASSIQKIASTQGMDASKTQSLLSAMGGFLQPALQQQQQTMGAGSLGSLVGQLGAGETGASVTTLLPPQMQQQMVQGIAQKTGLSPNMLQSALPVLVPAVMGLLHMGASKPGIGGSNPLLGAFLDSNRDGQTDLGDAFKFATRFLSSGR